MSTLFWIWMAAALIFLIIELMTPSLFFACFTVGAIGAGILAHFAPEAYYWQIGLFVIISVVLLPLTRRFAGKITKPSPELSNIDRMIGQAALVVQEIDPDNGGKIRYQNETWRANAGERIDVNVKVKIVSISGTTLNVERLQ